MGNDQVVDEAIVCEELGIGWLELMATPADHIEARMQLKQYMGEREKRDMQQT